MFHKKFFVIYLFVFNLSFAVMAQKKVNHITYKVLIKDRQSLIGPIGAKEMELTLQGVETVKPELFFNDSISKFIVPIDFEKMNPNKLSLAILNLESVITYFNKNNKFNYWLQNFRITNEKYLVHKKYFADWKLENESKIICGQKCFKATTMLFVDIGDGEKNQEFPITAWYSKNLKNDFGPNGYSGLPGLILELDLPLVTYEAISLNYQEIANEIEIPTNNKEISKTEFYKLFK